MPPIGHGEKKNVFRQHDIMDDRACREYRGKLSRETICISVNTGALARARAPPAWEPGGQTAHYADDAFVRDERKSRTVPTFSFRHGRRILTGRKEGKKKKKKKKTREKTVERIYTSHASSA